MNEPSPLHRLFALSWMDFFQGTTTTVEAEIDLSLKQQFIDLVIIHKGPGAITLRLPDGFDDMAVYNLLTFKSHQEALDGWTLLELAGHYVNYRKQISPSMQNLLPEEDFRLFAACARYPRELARQMKLKRLRKGVYVVRLATTSVRIIVLSQLPKRARNAMLHLFSAREELVRYGQEHYHTQSSDTSTLMYRLFETYYEDPDMPDKLKEFVRKTIDEMLAKMSTEERLKGVPAEELRKRLSPEERLKGLPPEERLKGLPPEERLKGLLPEERLKGLPPEERLKGLTSAELETVEELARRLKTKRSHKPKSK